MVINWRQQVRSRSQIYWNWIFIIRILCLNIEEYLLISRNRHSDESGQKKYPILSRFALALGTAFNTNSESERVISVQTYLSQLEKKFNEPVDIWCAYADSVWCWEQDKQSFEQNAVITKLQTPTVLNIGIAVMQKSILRWCTIVKLLGELSWHHERRRLFQRIRKLILNWRMKNLIKQQKRD